MARQVGFWAQGVTQVTSQSDAGVTNNNVPHMPCRLSDTDGIIMYGDAVSSRMSARHFSINESTYALTVDAELVIRSGTPAGETGQKLIRLDATNALAIIQGSGSAAVGVVITNSGGTLSKGSETTVNSGTNLAQIDAYALDSTRVLVCFRDTSTTVKVRVLSVSGTTVTAGTELQITDATSQFGFICGLTSSRAILMTGTGEAYLLTISGTTVTAGTKQTISGISAARYGNGMGMTSTIGIVAYNEAVDNPQALVVILRDNLDGTITGGTPTPVLTATMDTNNSYGMSISRITDNRALVGTLGLKSGGDGGYFAEVIGVDGLTPNQNLGPELFETRATWGGTFAFCRAMSDKTAVLLGDGSGVPMLYSWKVS